MPSGSRDRWIPPSPLVQFKFYQVQARCREWILKAHFSPCVATPSDNKGCGEGRGRGVCAGAVGACWRCGCGERGSARAHVFKVRVRAPSRALGFRVQTCEMQMLTLEEHNSCIALKQKCQRRSGWTCLLYTSPSPRDKRQSRMPSSA